MKLLRKARILLPALLVFVLGGAALALLMRPRERLLLPLATQIAELSGAKPYYWWLSEDEVLRFRDSALVRLNINTRKEAPAEGVTRLFDESDGKPDSIQVAQDGRWLFWTAADGRTIVSSADGKKRYEYPAGRPSVKRWMNEGLRWVELLHDGRDFTGALIRNVVDPEGIEKRPIVPTISCSPELVDLANIAPTTDDHILATLWNGHPGGVKPAVIVAMVLNAHLHSVGKFKLPPPRQDITRGELVFAPIYGRLAWVARYRPAWFALSGKSERTGLWVSNMQDWKVREIGSLESGKDGPFAVKWSPDGGRLSFVYRDALWTVPAD